MSMNDLSLSVFFPAYNEVRAVGGLVEKSVNALEQLGIEDYELIIVDDGGTDGTGELADRLAKQQPRLKVVHHKTNLGYGAALSSGFEAATKEWVCFTDGDGQFDLRDLRVMLPEADKYQAVLGYRRQRSDHIVRKLNAWMWSVVVWLVIGVKVKDLDCGFKLVKRSLIQDILPFESKGAAVSAEILLRLKAKGAAYGQVPVEHYPRVGGSPTGANPKVILRAIGELAALRRRLKA
jgi:glycosyltransferase involved in cell wall biosynthesis